ncbi:PREDICTED: uncharacterized protein LOC105569814 [Vollenhovia emeryi]|uniref:uncharacterized protein LOC105569814 n=1 Tax=Vollenhovia emeryi TaxID=411798 RepID=UPI0005F46F70|nr:PREDICTED: uncharacterized protein LOC105569814 [Vollenhovia emeryi]
MRLQVASARESPGRISIAIARVREAVVAYEAAIVDNGGSCAIACCVQGAFAAKVSRYPFDPCDKYICRLRDSRANLSVAIARVKEAIVDYKGCERAQVSRADLDRNCAGQRSSRGLQRCV